MITISISLIYFFLIKTLVAINSNFTQKGTFYRKPNIMLLMSDDRGFVDVNYNTNNNLGIQTPHLDQMVKEGLRFNWFYATPNCSPTRALVLIGRHPFRTGVFNPDWAMNTKELTIAQVLTEAGYNTEDVQLQVQDGESILPLFEGELSDRKKSIPFYFQKQVALIDGDFRLLTTNENYDTQWELYNLENDPSESTNLSVKMPDRVQKMKSEAIAVTQSIQESASGKDYPEGKVLHPARREFWFEMGEYKSYFETFFKRWEYAGYKKRADKLFNNKSSN